MSTLANAAREAASAISPAALEAGIAAALAAAPSMESRPDNPAPGTQASGAGTAPVTAVTLPAAIDANAIRAEARTAERDRIKAIVGHAEAEGRTALAHELAFGTDLAPDAAASLLTTAPKAENARTLTGATVPQPNVRPQASVEPGDAKSRLAAARMALTGAKA
jgi:hypothetical protein